MYTVWPSSLMMSCFFFFFNDTATTEIYTPSLHDALPICFFDGFRLDVAGNIWTSAGGGGHCYAPHAPPLRKIAVPEVVANVCFGGPKRNRLFICGTTSLYSIFLATRGCQRPAG